MTQSGWTLVIHGGAGMMTRDRITPGQDAGAGCALGLSLDAGSAVLAAGGSLRNRRRAGPMPSTSI